ncbi:molybdenum cofactor guanylyltransferase [Acidobacteria bacterium AB60]|nr:molybdenum cofactor guanylyltransferase [Acidobacteria bacterium AB60]
MTHDQAQDVAGFVLAGGNSIRMGRDKAVVEIQGHTLISLALQTLQSAGLSPAISGARSQLAHLAVVIRDELPGEGPLAGVCSALANTEAELVVLIPIDLPLVPPSLLRILVSDARITGSAVTLVSANGFPQTFPAVIRRSLLPLLQQELHSGRRGCFAAFDVAAKQIDGTARIIPAELLAQAGLVHHSHAIPVFQWFWNLNTPEEVRRVSRLHVI